VNPRSTKGMKIALFVILVAAVVLAYGFGVLSGIAAAINLDHLDDVDEPPPAS